MTALSTLRSHSRITITFSVQFSSVTQLCPTLCDPMNHSMPGLHVRHQLPEFTQTHVHRVSDVIKPSHPLLSPSPPAPNHSQHQGLFQWVNSSRQITKILELQLQHQSIFMNYLGLISLKIDWFDLLAVQRTFKCLLQHHSLKASILWLYLLYSPALTTIHEHWEDHSLDYMDLWWQSPVSAFQHTV